LAKSEECINVDASCENQACCKLLSAGLLQVVIRKLAASCYPQACCKLLSAGLLQVVICRLAASCSDNLQQARG
jgi:hypothetical protein